MNRKKTENILKQELKRLLPSSLWKEDDGSYHLYGIYRIIEVDDAFAVLKDKQERWRFGSRRAAAVWCVADRCGDYPLSQTIRGVDSQLTKLHNDLGVRCSITGSEEFIELVSVKVEPKQRRLNQLRLDLDRCVRLAKHYQRGIANENIRSCSAPPSKTSR